MNTKLQQAFCLCAKDIVPKPSFTWTGFVEGVKTVYMFQDDPIDVFEIWACAIEANVKAKINKVCSSFFIVNVLS